MLHEGKVVPELNEAPRREDIRRNGAMAVLIPDFGIDTIPADPPSSGRKSGNFRKGPQERSEGLWRVEKFFAPARNRIPIPQLSNPQ